MTQTNDVCFFPHLCMEESQTFGRVQRDQHFHQELFMFCLQWQRKAIDDAVNGARA